MMPFSDVWIVFRWWAALFLLGAAAYPVTSVVFSSWHDRGYLFSKAIGFALVSWLVLVFASLHLLPFGLTSLVVSMSIVVVVGLVLSIRFPLGREKGIRSLVRIGIEEVVFFCALLVWTWVKAHEPSIRGLEKFMDYGFMNMILHSSYFPPKDMWYPPFSINYYYFGHLVTAVITKLSGLDLSYTFNLMLSTIFALCLTMSYSIGYQLGKTKRLMSGIVSALLVTLAGNMQTIYALTVGYPGDAVVPLWQIEWSLRGITSYWYANATRFIPYTIHEFPSYSFVVSDVHGHVLSIPFVLCAIALLVTFWQGRGVLSRWMVALYGFFCGVLLMTNALDGPIYGALFVGMLLLFQPGDWFDWRYWKTIGIPIGIVILSAAVASAPFLFHFSSFVSGLAVNCPPAFLANSKIGPFLFETVDKCQKSPLWMMALLWGFFWFTGGVLLYSMIRKGNKWSDMVRVWNTKITHEEKILFVWFVFSLGLLIFPEFFYFKDIYPMHFRSNTMFKLGYDAFILCSLVAAYVLVEVVRTVKPIAFRVFCVVVLIPQLFLVGSYPYFSVRSYFGQLSTYDGIYGLGWLDREYPENAAVIRFLLDKPAGVFPVIAEADGDSYTDNNQISVFAATPTVIGWGVHEWLWRGSYDVVSPRRDDVHTLYESADEKRAREIIDRYNIRYVVVGTLERNKFARIDESALSSIGTVVFSSGSTLVYDVSQIHP